MELIYHLCIYIVLELIQHMLLQLSEKLLLEFLWNKYHVGACANLTRVNESSKYDLSDSKVNVCRFINHARVSTAEFQYTWDEVLASFLGNQLSYLRASCKGN